MLRQKGETCKPSRRNKSESAVDQPKEQDLEIEHLKDEVSRLQESERKVLENISSLKKEMTE